MDRTDEDGTSHSIGTRWGRVRRRRLLALSATGLISALAGCGSGDSGGDDESPEPTASATATPSDGPDDETPTETPTATATRTGRPTETATPTDATSTDASATETGTARGTGGSTGSGFDASYLEQSPSSEFAPTDGFASVDWLAERDVEVLKVTNLDESGEGSLRWALQQASPRIVVFEVGGVIDLQGRNVLTSGSNLYVAGQTAPSPGITVIRGGIFANAPNTVFQHVRVRPGDQLAPGEITDEPAGRAVDALSADSDTPNVLFDHCSVSWGSDENMSASGGERNRNVTFSNNIVAECLSKTPLHPESEHSKATLVNDLATNVAILGNVFVHNTDRHPRIKGGSEAAAVNNFVYDFYEAVEMGGGPNEPALGSIVGNYYKAGQATDPSRPLILAEGQGGAKAYVDDNVSEPEMPTRSGGLGIMTLKYVWPDGLEPIPGEDVPSHNLATAGARPADRTPHDERVIEDARNGGGQIIDSQRDVGGYPDLESTERTLDPPAVGDGLAEWLYQHTKAVELPDAEPP